MARPCNNKCLDLKTVFSRYIVLSGVFLLRFTACIPWIYGNLSAYTNSYFLFRVEPQVTDVDTDWLLPAHLVSAIVALVSVDLLVNKIGMRPIYVTSFVLFDLGIGLTYFTVQRSAWLMMMTLMICCGYTSGIISVLSLKYASKVMPRRVGLGSALISGSNGIGALLMNYIITAYINPDNLSPDSHREGLAYFSQVKILQNVPSVFIIVGATAFAIQVIGYILEEIPLYFNKDIIIEKLCSLDAIDEKTRLRNLSKDSPIGQCSKEHNVKELLKTGRFSRENKIKEVPFEPANENGDIRLNMRDDENLPSAADGQQPPSLKPLEVLHTRSFHVLCLCVSGLTYGALLTITYFKFFGQLWIEDDAFLTSVGGFGACANFFVRLAIGAAMDTIGVRNTSILITAMCAVLPPFWYIAPRVNKWLYFFCHLALSAIQSSIYTMIPVAAMKLYGQKYFATNYGLIMIANVITNLVSPIVFASLLDNYGWFSALLVGSIASIVSLLCFVFVMKADRNYK